jgi:N6-adenosine-specific RNA methylase IME4
MTPIVNPKFRALIPPLSQAELSQLEQNILADGCRDPLVTWNGVLLDGHNRYEICEANHVPFRTVAVDLPDEDAAIDWIISNQLGRRNLTPDQSSYFRGTLYNRRKKRHGAEPGGRGNQHLVSGQTDHLPTAELLSAELGVSEKTIRRDGKRAEAIDKLAEIKPEEAQAVKDGLKRFNEVRREIKRAEVRQASKLPEAKYRVIYADPPWNYNDKCDSGAVQSGGCEKHYPAMTIPALCAMPVNELCESDAVLFLWVTSPMLFECGPVIEAWGFRYKASFIWDKVKHNMGHYNSVRHELLLICTRGSCTPDTTKLFDSVQTIERTKHSAKPEKFREIIDTLYPHGKRIELFARKQAKGWESWGNQA